MDKKDSHKPDRQATSYGLTRREVLTKYGAYTAPAVVSLLAPRQALAMFAGTTFADQATCVAVHMANGQMMSNMHCMNNH